MGVVNKEELTELLGDRIVQVGIIVKDMAKARQGMLDVFGLEPDSEGDVVYKQVRYRGQTHDAPVRNAFYNYFNLQLEFLQPIGQEDTIWRDYLNMGQYSLHHLRWNVEDNDEVTRLMAEKGIDVWMEGESLVTPGKKFTYYDSLDKVGFIIEAVTA